MKRDKKNVLRAHKGNTRPFIFLTKAHEFSFFRRCKLYAKRRGKRITRGTTDSQPEPAGGRMYPMKKIRANFSPFSANVRPYVCRDKEIMGSCELTLPPHVLAETFGNCFLPLCVSRADFSRERATLKFGRHYE